MAPTPTPTPTKERNAALSIAEAGLWLALLGGVLAALATVRELAWSLFGWGWLLGSGGRMAVPALTGTLNDASQQAMQLPLLETVRTSRGTVDAATGLPPAYFSGPIRVSVSIDQLPAWQDFARLAPDLLMASCVTLGAWLLLRIVRSARVGEVFTMSNAVRLRWLAGVVGVGGLAHNTLEAFVPNWILSSSAAASYVDTSTFTMNLAPVLLALVIAALAIIWEHGVNLARDAEGLI